jgi:hypothetical protein
VCLPHEQCHVTKVQGFHHNGLPLQIHKFEVVYCKVSRAFCKVQEEIEGDRS